MSESLLNTKIKCRRCKALIDINEKQEYIYKIECKDKYGKHYWITYIDCPMCGNRHYMQIDDIESNRCKNECISIMGQILKKHINGKSIPQSQQSKYKKKNKQLQEIRFELMKNIIGKELFDNDGNKIIIEEFTTC